MLKTVSIYTISLNIYWSSILKTQTLAVSILLSLNHFLRQIRHSTTDQISF